MFLGLFLRNGNDGDFQALADSRGNVFKRHTLFGDSVVPGYRRAFLQRDSVEPATSDTCAAGQRF